MTLFSGIFSSTSRRILQGRSKDSVLRAASGTRFLNLHEYQSQELLRQAGVKVPRGVDVSSRDEALSAAKSLGDDTDIVVKAQVLAGGRGLGTFANGFKGGVHICYDVEKAADIASKMIGQHLVTKQTGAEGRLCSKALVTERLYIRREMYFAITYDRESSGPVIVASRVGGTSIEDIAAADPTAISKIPVDMNEGVTDKKATEVAVALGFSPERVPQAADQVKKLYDFFAAKDATLVEINPLAETPEGDVVCVDAKVNFDDNASFRHKEIHSMRDVTQEDPREVRAAEHDLNYIGLDGNIGCLVNGAGLAMATMDIIKLHNGDPANFLDVGGSATESQVMEAFSILNADPKVEAILVNIFGGIMRCDVIAQGIIDATSKLDMRVPVVVRLQGNKVDEAKSLIAESGLRIIAVDDLDLAAKKACTLAQIVRLANTVDVKVGVESK